MNIFDILSLLGGLVMFLYGMRLMGRFSEREQLRSFEKHHGEGNGWVNVSALQEYVLM